MLLVNCGGLQDEWLRVSHGEEARLGTFDVAIRRAYALTRQRPRIPSGSRVLAPDGATHQLRPAVVDDEAERRRRHRAGERSIEWQDFQSGPSSSVAAEARLVPLDGYALRLLDGCEIPLHAHEVDPTTVPVCVWRAEIWCEGLFSMLFWALGYLELLLRAEKQAGRTGPTASEHSNESSSQNDAPRSICVLIDWTDERILFHASDARGRRPPANAWNSFFEQPGQIHFGSGALRSGDAREARMCQAASSSFVNGGSTPGSEESTYILTVGRLQQQLDSLFCSTEAPPNVSISCAFGEPVFPKFGHFKGADQGFPDENAPSVGSVRRGGRLDEATAEAGRLAVRRWIRVRQHIRQRVERTRSEIGLNDPTEWLAVHVRRTDKLQQCSGNDVPESELLSHIRGFCEGLGCSGVLLCSDDASFKLNFASRLRSFNIRVAHVDVPLSERQLPAHLDPSLDARANAEDVLVEALLMGTACKALLSTWSNVSVAAVFFSQRGYRHALFGDDPPLPPPFRPLRMHNSQVHNSNGLTRALYSTFAAEENATRLTPYGCGPRLFCVNGLSGAVDGGLLQLRAALSVGRESKMIACWRFKRPVHDGDKRGVDVPSK